MRTQLGIISLLLLAGAVIRYLTTGNLSDMLLGGLLRIGLVVGALWLALPGLKSIFAKTPKWLIGALFVSVVVFALRPQLLWWLPVALIAVWFGWSRFGSWLKPGPVTTSGPAPRRPKRKGG